jgi:hypothetical protein
VELFLVLELASSKPASRPMSAVLLRMGYAVTTGELLSRSFHFLTLWESSLYVI